jgi:hypothetical protein
MKLHNSHGTTGTDWYLPKQQASNSWNTHGTTTTTKQAKVGLSPTHGPHGRKEGERVYRAPSSKSEYKREGSARSGSTVGLASDGQGGPRGWELTSVRGLGVRQCPVSFVAPTASKVKRHQGSRREVVGVAFAAGVVGIEEGGFQRWRRRHKRKEVLLERNWEGGPKGEAQETGAGATLGHRAAGSVQRGEWGRILPVVLIGKTKEKRKRAKGDSTGKRVRDFQPFCAEGPIGKIKRERGESRARTEGERDKRSVLSHPRNKLNGLGVLNPATYARRDVRTKG